MLGRGSGKGLAEVQASVHGLVAKLLLDAQQLVVLRVPLRSARSACLDLARAQADGQVRDEHVLGLTGAVRNHDAPALLLAHLARLDGLGDGADLVHLQEQRVACRLVALHGLRNALRVRDQQIIAHDLNALADVASEEAISVPIVLVEGVLDGHHWVLLDPTLVILRKLLAGHQGLALLLLVLPIQVVLLLVAEVELGGRDVGADLDLGLVAGLLDGLHEDL
mmetsp:Transcript_104443/g.271899  ORF Transcript_104443/g.271899 Transcript_104443/m.271899 type:complete len:223 (+) Transcript_104443:78-746(+)